MVSEETMDSLISSYLLSQPPPSPYRFAILSTRLLHSNLSVIHYSVFFQMCRAHGIGFDMKVRHLVVCMRQDVEWAY